MQVRQFFGACRSFKRMEYVFARKRKLVEVYLRMILIKNKIGQVNHLPDFFFINLMNKVCDNRNEALSWLHYHA